MNAQRFCQYCGSPMEPDWQFCERCGGQPAVESPPPEEAPTVFHPRLEVPPAPPASAPPQASTPRPAAPQRVQPKPAKPKSPVKWLLPVGIGCVTLVCLCLFVVAGYFFLMRPTPTSQPATPTQIAEILPAATEVPSQPEVPAETQPPEPTDWPTAAVPTETPWPTAEPTEASQLTGNQSRSDTAIFDDFSSKALGWEEFDNGTTIIQYENEAYSFQLFEQDYWDWIVAPVYFWPDSIQFDVWGLPGRQNGNYGVMCQFQDADNYNYVEVIPDERLFTIGTVRAGELTYLTIPDASGDYWLEAAPLKASPQEVNRFDVGCYRDVVVLAINDALVYHVNIPDPLPDPGEITLFVYTYPDAGPQGYKVFFDNVGIQQTEE
jgi:hypothetical protein